MRDITLHGSVRFLPMMSPICALDKRSPDINFKYSSSVSVVLVIVTSHFWKMNDSTLLNNNKIKCKIHLLLRQNDVPCRYTNLKQFKTLRKLGIRMNLQNQSKHPQMFNHVSKEDKSLAMIMWVLTFSQAL